MAQPSAEPLPPGEPSPLGRNAAWISPKAWVAGVLVWAAASAAGCWLLTLPENKQLFGGDFIAFWGAAKSLSQHKNPYDPQNLRPWVADQGAPLDAKKLGYDYVPFYYPPWSVYPVLPLLPWGYRVACNLWVTWGMLTFFASVWLLAERRGSFPFLVRALLFGGMAMWVLPLRFGQVVAPTLLLLILCELAWEQGRDRWLGFFLVLAAIKPQISALPVLLVLACAARDRRWNVWISAALWGAAAGLSACWFRPLWLLEMLDSTRLSPPPTVVHGPAVGCSLWSMMLYLFGREGVGLWVAVVVQTAVAVGIAVWMFKAVLRREASMERLISAGVLAVWFLSPYLRWYDLPLLCLPLCHLLGGKLPDRVKAMFAALWLIAPQLDSMILWKTVEPIKAWGLDVFLETQLHWWWVALLIGAFWLADAFEKDAPHEVAPETAATEPPLTASAPPVAAS